jgi:hypothetical protein
MRHPRQNSRRHKDVMKQVPYWVPTNIRRHRTKFSRHGDLATGICASWSTGLLSNRCLNSRCTSQSSDKTPLPDQVPSQMQYILTIIRELNLTHQLVHLNLRVHSSLALLVYIVHKDTHHYKNKRYYYLRDTTTTTGISTTATGISGHFSTTLTEVFPCFFLSCKANARV